MSRTLSTAITTPRVLCCADHVVNHVQMDHVDAIAELHASDGTDTEYIEEQKAMLAADTE